MTDLGRCYHHGVGSVSCVSRDLRRSTQVRTRFSPPLTVGPTTEPFPEGEKGPGLRRKRPGGCVARIAPVAFLPPRIAPLTNGLRCRWPRTARAEPAGWVEAATRRPMAHRDGLAPQYCEATIGRFVAKAQRLFSHAARHSDDVPPRDHWADPRAQVLQPLPRRRGLRRGIVRAKTSSSTARMLR